MDKREYKNMWVHIEHTEGKVSSAALELCCEIRKLCDQSGDKLIGVIAGSIPEGELEKLKECGIDGAIEVSGTGYERYNTEAFSNLYVELSKKYKPSAIFIGATANGRDFAPHFAACLETGCTSDATELIYNPETTDIEFVEPAAGGKIMAVITIPVLRPQVGTIRPGTFKYVPTGKKAEFELVQEHIDFDPTKIRTKLVEYKANEFDPELDIAYSVVRYDSLRRKRRQGRKLAEVQGACKAARRQACGNAPGMRQRASARKASGRAVGRHDKAQALHRLRRIRRCKPCHRR